MKARDNDTLLRIRHACSLGLPGRALLPIVIRELRQAIPSVCGQFTWASDSGALANHWCDQFLPRRVAWIILHRQQYEADCGTSFADLVRFGRDTGNLRSWWTRGFERSDTYRAVFKPYRFKWMLDGVVRDAERPWGCVVIVRDETQPDFSAGEERLLARTLPYLAHALRSEAVRPRRFVRTGRSALLVCSAEGEVLEWSAEAHRLVVWALEDRINVDTAVRDGDFHEMRCRLKAIVRRCRHELERVDPDAPLPEVVLRNGWGEFVLRAYRLGNDAGTPDRIGLLIEHCVPYEARLLEQVNALDLTARQKEVVLLTGRGLANAQIAEALRITGLTLKDYLKDIYARLGVCSREELLARLGCSGLDLAA